MTIDRCLLIIVVLAVVAHWWEVRKQREQLKTLEGRLFTYYCWCLELTRVLTSHLHKYHNLEDKRTFQLINFIECEGGLHSETLA